MESSSIVVLFREAWCNWLSGAWAGVRVIRNGGSFRGGIGSIGSGCPGIRDGFDQAGSSARILVVASQDMSCLVRTGMCLK